MIDLLDKTPTVDEIRNTSVSELFSSLSTDNTGLSSQESKSRLEKYGYNEIEEKKITNAFGWKFDNSKGEYDTDCINKTFYKVNNGIMLDCHPENIIYTNMTLLKNIRNY